MLLMLICHEYEESKVTNRPVFCLVHYTNDTMKKSEKHMTVIITIQYISIPFTSLKMSIVHIVYYIYLGNYQVNMLT